jgi:hypothetical protein
VELETRNRLSGQGGSGRTLTAGLLSPQLLNLLAAGCANPFLELPKGDALRLQHKFDDRGKQLAAKALGRMGEVEGARAMENFRPVIEKLRAHLFGVQVAAE